MTSLSDCPSAAIKPPARAMLQIDYVTHPMHARNGYKSGARPRRGLQHREQ